MTTDIQKDGVYRMFDAIASTYDRVNRILSLGIDCYWRRKMVSHLPQDPLKLLDLATGTGDQIFALIDRHPIEKAIGLDLSQEMLAIGVRKCEKKGATSLVDMRIGDAQEIPLEDKSVNCITMSFGIRNVPDVPKCLAEMHRTLLPGGKSLILEFSLPKCRVVRSLHLFYIRKILPRIGRLLSKHETAYSYLNETIETFPYGEAFCTLLKNAGFAKITFIPLTFGIATLYVAEKGE
jgi:demethylmenaquinone methyltransferase / 2-methoxy-6-polyprenyl-1,4-benzoquinol methylase